jgi:hypothetical protein
MACKQGGTIMDDSRLVDTLNEHLSHINAKGDLKVVDILNERLTRIKAIADTTEELRNSPNEVHAEIVEELMRVIVLEVDTAKHDLSSSKR